LSTSTVYSLFLTADMTDLQASIDFSIELGTLTNVDLFQKG